MGLEAANWKPIISFVRAVWSNDHMVLCLRSCWEIRDLKEWWFNTGYPQQLSSYLIIAFLLSSPKAMHVQVQLVLTGGKTPW